jgi:sugar phosphate isomerase/epimerase
MIKVYASTGAFRSGDLRAIWREAQAAGIDGLELSSGVAVDQDIEAALRDRPRTIDYLVHNYFPPVASRLVINLGSRDEGIRDESIAYCKRAIDLARQVAAPFYSVHSAFCVDPTADELGGAGQIFLDRAERNVARDRFYAALEELANHADRAGVVLCIENNPCESRNLIDGENLLDLMTSPADFEDFNRRPALSRIGFLIDVGHVKVSARAEGFAPADFFDAVRERTLMLHLSDNDGLIDQNRGFGADAWFWPYVVSCPRVAAAVVEVYRIEPAEIARLCCEARAQLAAAI